MQPLASAARVCSSVMLCAIVLGACARPVPPRTIRVGYAGDADFGDLPSFMAHSRLRELGYRVEVTHFSAPDLAIEAASRGSLEFVHGSMVGAWTAASRGARVRTVMDHVSNPYRLVVVADIAVCAGLDGRRLALAGESTMSTHLVRAFMQEECPMARPVQFFMMESTNRAAAFLAGGVDASPVELSVLLWLEGQAPGRFRVLSDFAARWPLIKTTGVHVNTDFATAHPAVVLDYVGALVAANRDALADTDLLVSEATQKLGASALWPAVARAYVDARAWPVDGGLTAAGVERTLDFFKAHSDFERDVNADDVADLTFLVGALAVARR